MVETPGNEKIGDYVRQQIIDGIDIFIKNYCKKPLGDYHCLACQMLEHCDQNMNIDVNENTGNTLELQDCLPPIEDYEF